MNNLLVWLWQFILPRRYWYRRLYLRSNHWQTVKRMYKKQACENCGKVYSLDLHHKTYYENGRSVLWHEKKKHLKTLCRECHDKEHLKG